MSTWDLIIVGAGVAGVSAYHSFRELAPTARVLLIEAENHPPYKRTKLSKILASGTAVEDFALESGDFWQANPLTDLRLGRRVQTLEPATKTLTLDDGSSHQYVQLLLATGAQPLVSPALVAALPEALVFRSAQDLTQLRAAIVGFKKAAVLGDGILGVEVAEQLSLAGLSVTLVGRGAYPMHRELTERLGREIAQVLSVHGIELVSGIAAEDWLRGQSWKGLTVVCVGSRPDLVLAKSAGVATDRGILVDEFLQTDQIGVFAAGDCIQDRDGRVTHLWHESEDQGWVAGRNLGGVPTPWRSQGYRTKCEVFGHYVWSMGERDASLETIEVDSGPVYYAAFLKQGRIGGLVMRGDRDRAKIYEEAVRKAWFPEDLQAALRGPA